MKDEAVRSLAGGERCQRTFYLPVPGQSSRFDYAPMTSGLPLQADHSHRRSALRIRANGRLVVTLQIFQQTPVKSCGIGLPSGPLRVMFAIDLRPQRTGRRIAPIERVEST